VDLLEPWRQCREEVEGAMFLAREPRLANCYGTSAGICLVVAGFLAAISISCEPTSPCEKGKEQVQNQEPPAKMRAAKKSQGVVRPSAPEQRPNLGPDVLRADLPLIKSALADFFKTNKDDPKWKRSISPESITAQSLEGKISFSTGKDSWCVGEWSVRGSPSKCTATWARLPLIVSIDLEMEGGAYRIVRYSGIMP